MPLAPRFVLPLSQHYVHNFHNFPTAPNSFLIHTIPHMFGVSSGSMYQPSKTKGSSPHKVGIQIVSLTK